MKLVQNQSGVSLIAAIFIIVILAFMGMVFLTLFTVTSSTSINELQSTQALYVAEGGMERSIRYFTSPTLTERVACASIPAANTSLGSGQFSLTIEAGSPFYSSAATTLSGAIGVGDTTINVASTANYAPFGRIMIDRELIDYTGTTANSFTGALRGRDGTTATSHAGPPNAARVGQYQCTVTSTGGVYNLTTPNARRQVRQGIQLQEGWAVGDRNGNNLTFIRWNRDIEVQWNDASFNVGGGARADLNSVSLLNYSDGWAVGDERNGFTIRRLNPDGTPPYWDVSPGIPAPANEYVKNLLGVYAVSSREAWAVGFMSDDIQPGPGQRFRFTILRWNGDVNAWCLLDPAGNCNGITIPADNSYNQNLNSIYMLDTDNDGIANAGWAVGNNGFCYNPPLCTISRAIVLRWNGVSWSSEQPPTQATENLNSVFMVSQNEVWIAGNDRGGGANNALIFRWQNGVWTYTDPGVDNDLSSIYMLDTDSDGLADDGWAVGAVSGGRPTMLRWNYNCAGTAQNNQWNNCTASAPNTGQRLNSVFMITATDGWAVGNGGTILHWDGNSWSVHPQSGVVTAQNLRSLSMIGPKQRPQAMWREVFQ